MPPFSVQMQNIWDIDEPAFKHTKHAVTLDYGFNSILSTEQVKYAIFDGVGCQEESRQISIENNYLTSQMALGRPDMRTGKSKAELSLVVAADTIESSPIAERVDNDHVEVTFCVRFSLYTGDAASSSADSIEVNFLETPVKLRYRLREEFIIDLDTSPDQ
jgi:hypothetical protein